MIFILTSIQEDIELFFGVYTELFTVSPKSLYSYWLFNFWNCVCNNKSIAILDILIPFIYYTWNYRKIFRAHPPFGDTLISSCSKQILDKLFSFPNRYYSSTKWRLSIAYCKAMVISSFLEWPLLADNSSYFCCNSLSIRIVIVTDVSVLLEFFNRTTNSFLIFCILHITKYIFIINSLIYHKKRHYLCYIHDYSIEHISEWWYNFRKKNGAFQWKTA